MEYPSGTSSFNGTDTVANASLTATITKLPSRGTVFQSDSHIAITNVPTIVDSANQSVTFSAPDNDFGVPYTSFEYNITSSRGPTSPPARVTINLTPIYQSPVATLSSVQTFENSNVIFQITYTDPNPPDPTNHVTAFIFQAPLIGNLYQVGSDNVTPGAVISGDGTPVSNTNGLVYYVPPALTYGLPLTSFTCYLENSYGLFSSLDSVVINVSHVDQPPVNFAKTNTGFTDVYITGASLNFSDPDPGDTLTVCFTHIDDNIKIYTTTPIIPQNQVTNGMCVTNISFFRIVPVGSGSGFLVFTNFGSPFATYSYYVSDGTYSSPMVTNTFNLLYRNFFPDPSASPASVAVPNKNPVTITLQGTDPDGDSANLIFTIKTLPTNGSLSLPNGLAITHVPYDLPSSDPTIGWPVRYTLNSNYSNAFPSVDSFGFGITDETDLAYPLPLTVQLLVAPQ